MPQECNQYSKLAAFVSRAFSLVDGTENQWAHDYLLGYSPSSSLRLFSNPSSVGKAVVSRSVDTVHALPPGRMTVAVEGKHSFDAVLVPELHENGLCVGALVSRFTRVAPMAESLGDPTDATKYVNIDAISLLTSRFSELSMHPHFCSTGRFVRNEANGNILIVMHSSDPPNVGLGQTQVLYVEQISTTRRVRTYFLCDTDVFCTGRYAESVRKYYAYEDWRFCPVCRSSPSANCSCKMSQKDMAYDFNVFGSVETFISDYMGIADVTVALEVTNPKRISDSSLYASLSDTLLNTLARAEPGSSTYTDYMSVRCMSNVHTKRSFPGHRDSCHDDIVSSLISFAVQDFLKQRNLGEDSLFMSTPYRQIAAGIDQMEDSDAMAQTAEPQMSGIWDNVLDSETDARSNAGHVLGLDMSPLQSSSGQDESFETNRVSGSLSSGLDDSSAAHASLGIGQETPFSGEPGLQSHLQHPPRHIDDDNSPWLNGVAGVSDEVSSLPAPAEQFRRRRRSRGLDVDCEEMSTREMQRKLRNRESAAKANAKKKAFVDDLKRGIQDAKDMAAALNARHIELVKENMALRRQLMRQL